MIAPLLTTVITVGGAVSGAPAPGRPVCAAASWSHHVALVVENSDGRVVRVCVGFEGSSVTGDQLLAASGVEYATAGSDSFGKAVCQINSEPVSYPPTCWTTTSPYWVMFVARGSGPWAPSSLGVSTQTFADGDAEGFRYDPQSGPDPPPPSAAGTCDLTPVNPGPGRPAPSSPAQRSRTASPAAAVSTPIAPATAGTPTAAAAAAGSTMPTSTATATPGVAAVRSTGPVPIGSTPTGVSVGSVLATGVGGGLLGLLLLRALRPRRR